jgi:hypothetical protein
VAAIILETDDGLSATNSRDIITVRASWLRNYVLIDRSVFGSCIYYSSRVISVFVQQFNAIPNT